MKYLIQLLILSSALALSAQTETIQHEKLVYKQLFFDEEDGSVDMSNFLLTKAGFLPVPILITNPAVGYGGLMAATFFHESMAESQGYPTISGVIGGGTKNGTWTVGAFHLRSFFDQKIRYSGFAGYGDVNLRFYGLGYTDYFQNNKHNLHANAYITAHKAQAQIGESNFYTGLQYKFVSNEISLKPAPKFLEDKLSRDDLISELSFVLSYDSRNNFFSPNEGIKAELNWNYSDNWLGASESYTSLVSYALGYTKIPFVDKLVAGLRVEYDVAFEGTPFYMYPFVNNRGVALMRYQDKQMFELETELTYNLKERWDIIGFAGVGDAFGTHNNNIFSNDIAVSGGAGFRYLLARKFGIKIGTDISYAEELSFQIVMGSAWVRN